jgi:hypothetical protein
MDRSTHCRCVRLASLYMFLMNVVFLVSAGQEEAVSELVGAGADVNRKNEKGITPLFVSRALGVLILSRIACPRRHYAASKSRIEVWII